jgi:hypothetical protein
MTSDARKPKARYAVFNCPVCAAGMTAAATRGHVPAEPRRRGRARRDEKSVGRRGSVDVVEVGKPKTITGVGDAERLRVGNDPHPRRDRNDFSAGPFATFACTT